MLWNLNYSLLRFWFNIHAFNMPTVKFQLRSPKEKTNQPIYLVFRHQNEKLVYGTGFAVNPKYWNSEKHRIRNVTHVRNRDEINNYLNDLETAIQDIFTQLKRKRQPISKEILKQELNYYLGKEKRPRRGNPI